MGRPAQPAPRRVLVPWAVAASLASTQVLLTFQAEDGRHCRLFRAEDACDGQGLACRDEKGWKLTARDASAPESVDGFRTAGASALVDGAMVAWGKPAMSEEKGGD